MRRYRVVSRWDDPYDIYEVQERVFLFWWKPIRLYWRKDDAYSFLAELLVRI